MRQRRAAGCVLASLLTSGLLAACGGGAASRSSLPVLSRADTDPAAGYERPPELHASTLLAPELAAGPHHRVDERVASDGFLRLYHVESDFGAFDAAGDLELRFLLQELRALASLDALREDPAFAAAELRAREDPFVVRFGLLEHPIADVRGMPAAAWREVLRIAWLRRAERSDAEVRDRDAVLAFEAGKRRLARRLGVNPYTGRAEIQAALNRTGWVMSAGGLPFESAPELVASSLAPTPEDVVPAERLERLYAYDSPEDLDRASRIELAVMGMPQALIEAFLSHPVWSVRERAGLVETLVALDPAGGRDAFVVRALAARTREDALFFVMGALILRLHHERMAPIEQIVMLNERTVAGYSDGRLVVPAQVDYLLWTRPVERFAQLLADAQPEGLAVTTRELWLSGTLSPRAREEFRARGIRAVEGVFGRVFERLAPGPEG